MGTYFHVTDALLDVGDVLTPGASRPDDLSHWNCIYTDENAWRPQHVWLFGSAHDAVTYDPTMGYLYEVEAQVTVHEVSDCLCGTKDKDYCESLDCDLPTQYLASQATITARVPLGVLAYARA